VSLESPYKGLAPFEDTDLDALLFFGRERESRIIAANVLASRLTVLYGPSGVGKSSVLRAGVIHRLRAEALANVEERGHPEFVAAVFDGWSDDPAASLREVVHDALSVQFGSALLDEREEERLGDTLDRWTQALACDLLLVLDQAEEYFLYHPEEAGFADELPELVTRPGLRVRVLLALRDDALAKLDRFKGRIPNLFSNYLRLDHLERNAARDAIVKPVERWNDVVGEAITVEPELIEAILDQTATGKVDLGHAGRGLPAGEADEGRIEAPYLQLVMERVWEEERAAGSTTLRAETLRRVGGAEAIVQTHLRRAVEELTVAEKDVAAEVFRYLVTPSGSKVAHGANDLADYASIDERRLMPVLSTLGRERIVRTVDGAGANGARYEIFHDVLAEPVLAWRREQELERERHEAARRQRRLLALAMGALLALAAMTAVAIYAFSQRSMARREGRDAKARALVGEAQAQLTSDPELSLLLAVRAAGMERSRLVEDTLRQALESSRVRAVRKIPPARRERLFQPGAEASAVSPDGRLLVMGRGNTARLVSRRTGRVLRIFKGGKLGDIQVGHRDRVIAVALSRDGEQLATGSKDGSGGLWRVADGFHITTLIGGHVGAITTVAFNPRGNLVATGSRDRTIRIFDTDGGRELLLLAGHRDEVKHVEFNRDGSLLRSFSTDGTERIWDPEREPRMHVIGTAPLPNPGPHMAVEGDKRATAAGNVVVLRDLSSGSRITLRGHKARVTSLHFDSQGKRLLTADEDGDVLIWDAETGAKRHLLRGHFGVVSDARFSPDGRWIVTAGPFSAGLWRSDSNTIHTFIRHTDRPVVARFDGNNRIITIARDGKVREWFCDFCGTTDELLALAKKRLARTGRTLTPEEKGKLLPH